MLELFRSLFARESSWKYIILVSRRELDFGQYPYVRQVMILYCNRITEWVYANRYRLSDAGELLGKKEVLLTLARMLHMSTNSVTFPPCHC